VTRNLKGDWNGQLSLFEDDSKRDAPSGSNTLVFDLETQRSFQEVLTFFEQEVDTLVELLLGAELVVGYNVLGFDYEVLKGYRDAPLGSVPTLDLMVDLQGKLGFRPKLDSVVQATLGAGKSADGLQALVWWKEGRLDLIQKYCQDDVALTRDLYLWGKRNRRVLVSRHSGSPIEVPVSW
jgi:DEAD/DEAH box helicase domain-containing protein